MSPNFRLSFNIKPSEFKIAYGDPVGFLGSCFSDEMHLKARFYGFNSFGSPFGTVFHPLAISRFVQETLVENTEERILQRNDLFFSEDAGSKLFSFRSDELFSNLKQVREEWRDQIASAKCLFITFGTAWGYRSATTGKIVANCHKLPGSHFTKELSSIHEIVSEWGSVIEQLKKFAPELRIVFTVSPVRHVRDGLVENNRSKAILIEAVRLLNEQTGTAYFPSYEIVIDELRDHQFFKEDRVHPSDEAVSCVWDRFIQTFCVEETVTIMQEVKRLRHSAQHVSLFEGSEEDLKHKASLSESERLFKVKHPEVRL
ncbi:MAG: GSCFA domain-containing protein [Flavobacteriales bacterium]